MPLCIEGLRLARGVFVGVDGKFITPAASSSLAYGKGEAAGKFYLRAEKHENYRHAN